MTLRTYLPYDVARCVGESNAEGELCKPCDTCARAQFTKPGQMGDRQSWIEPKCFGDKCPNYIKMEVQE